METKMYKEYLDYCTKRIDDNPDGRLKHLDYNYRGIVQYTAANYDESIADFTKAIELYGSFFMHIIIAAMHICKKVSMIKPLLIIRRPSTSIQMTL